MTISVSDAGKRFNRDWIFRNFTYTFNHGEAYAITGPNGSGKSTLLQVIGGAITPSEGSVAYEKEGKNIDPENIYQHLSIAAPYLELIEEMTATEFLHFHQQFKTFLPSVSISDILSKVGLSNASEKQIRYYSSGMKQRVKLAQAVFSNTPVLLLDEPCTNLDIEGIGLYHDLVRDFCSNRIILVSSNDLQEYDFCKTTISIMDYK